MNLVGRYNKVYRYLPYLNQCDGPYILDNKNHHIEPVRDEKWWKSKEGIWYPVVSGGVGNPWRGAEESGSMLGYSTLSNLSVTFNRHSLNSAYVAGSSGDAVAWSFVPTADMTLDTVYYMVDLYTGTAANVNDILVELRDDSSNSPDVSGAALDSVVSDPTSFTDRWVTVSGFSTALTAGTQYWIVVGDPDGNATDAAQVTTSFAQSEDGLLYRSSAWITAATSTNGFSSIAARETTVSAVIIAASDGTTYGNHPWSTRSGTATDGNQKGMFFGGGISTGNARVVGVQFMASDNDVDLESIKIWEGSTGPSGTPFATSVFSFQPAQNNAGYSGAIFSGTHSGNGYPKLTAGTDYRIVVQPASGQTMNLLNVVIGATTDANIRHCMPGKGNWYQTVESGGSWVDSTGSFINFAMILDDWEPTVAAAVASSGRSFPLVPA